MNRAYITTSIPYVNGEPHVGFALELVQADAIARYQRSIGKKTRFQTGTDENAFKNVLSAKKLGVGTQELVDRNSEVFRTLGEALNCAVDDFVRTTEERHRLGVHRLWEQLRPGDVYRKSYEGLYCTGCEDFLLERDLVDGRCPDHETEPAPVEEENWFFRLSAYQEQIEELIRSGRLGIAPEKRRREVLSFVERGLQDISVSRRAERVANWGVAVPGDEGQIIYVWIDALINYLSGPGFGESEPDESVGWREWWNEATHKVHVIGKNVWKFHAVYWPALLLSAGLPLPDEIVVHGFLTTNGRKIGKSLGNAVDPFESIERFGSDGVRYYLLRSVSPFDDGDFSSERLLNAYNGELANGLGNLVSRLTALAERGGYGSFTAEPIPDPPDGFEKALARHEFDRSLDYLWEVIGQVNREVEIERPWELLTEGNQEALNRLLDRWLTELHRIVYWLQPFLPEAAERVLKGLERDPIRAFGSLFPRIR
jgi:methionyl-tRNA synthetase